MKLKHIILALSLAVAATSCDDYLDVTSENQYPAHETLTSITELRANTAYLYAAPWYYFHKQRWVQLGDSRANNIYTGSSTNGYSLMASFGEQSDNTSLSHAWGSLYNVIAQADYIIEDYAPYCISNGIAAESDVNECIGEARFMRALAYWYLGMFWHDVPIVDSPVTIGTNAYANRFEDVLQYAICDAEYAAKWLKITPYATGRVSRVSAYALLSRLYLTAANYAQGGHFSQTFCDEVLAKYYENDRQWSRAASVDKFYYNKAVSAAEKCLSLAPNGGYGLMDDYEQIFRVQNNNCKEVLFALQFVAGSTTYSANNDQQTTYCYDRCIDNNFGIGYLKASFDFILCSKKRDGISRTRGNIMPPYFTYDYLYHEQDTCTQYGKTWTCGKYSTIPIKKQVVGGDLATDGAAIKDNSGFCTPMIRLSEVYLNLTEAKMGAAGLTETSSADILEGVNTVRRRAHKIEIADGTYRGDYGQNGAFNLDSMLCERRLEFFCESLSWPDVVRRSFMSEEDLTRMIRYNNNDLLTIEGDSIMGCHRLNSYSYTGIASNTKILGTAKLTTSISRQSKQCVHTTPANSYVHSSAVGESDNLWSMIYPPAETLQSPNLLQAPQGYDFSGIITNKAQYHD
jgi:hypothetical protein